MNKKLDYFWETEYYFTEFLKKVFGDSFKRKYSLTGNGIYNLLFVDGGIYEIDYKQGNVHFPNKVNNRHDGNSYPDCGAVRYGGPTKQEILYKIGDALKTDEVYAKSAEMSFPVGSWIAKIKIVKKVAEPQ